MKNIIFIILSLAVCFVSQAQVTSIKIKMIADPSGFLEEVLRVTLFNAQIVEHRMDLDYNPSAGNCYYTEKFYFTYSSIEYDHFSSGDNESLNWRY